MTDNTETRDYVGKTAILENDLLGRDVAPYFEPLAKVTVDLCDNVTRAVGEFYDARLDTEVVNKGGKKYLERMSHPLRSPGGKTYQAIVRHSQGVDHGDLNRWVPSEQRLVVRSGPNGQTVTEYVLDSLNVIAETTYGDRNESGNAMQTGRHMGWSMPYYAQEKHRPAAVAEMTRDLEYALDSFRSVMEFEREKSAQTGTDTDQAQIDEIRQKLQNI